MKKLLFGLLFLAGTAHAGILTINQNLGGNLGQVLISSTPAPTVGSTYSFIQQTSCNANTFTDACAYPSSVTSHSLLLVGCTLGSGSVSINNLAVSDNNSNTYVKVGALYTSNGSGGQGVGLFYALNANSGATTVTCHDTGNAAGYAQTSILEYGSTAGTGAFDVASSSSPTASMSNPSAPAITTSLASEFVFALASQGGGTSTGQSGTSRVNYVNNAYTYAEDTVVSAAGSYTSTFTAPSGNWVMFQAAFK